MFGSGRLASASSKNPSPSTGAFVSATVFSTVDEGGALVGGPGETPTTTDPESGSKMTLTLSVPPSSSAGSVDTAFEIAGGGSCSKSTLTLNDGSGASGPRSEGRGMFFGHCALGTV